jgi:MoaA/NifB/PqqE/SkfB family radical SAM enzyme
MDVPEVPLARLIALWIQITGTWCNLECRHCLNASGPKRPWLRPLETGVMRQAIADAERLGVREIYFTGGEPFLHKDVLEILEVSLGVASTTVLTNGTLIDERMADALAALGRAAPYSLEIRVSIDSVDRDRNDAIRGAGAWGGAVRAVELLTARGLLPIVTATDIADDEPGGAATFARFVDFLRGRGMAKPRVKLLPVFATGRMARAGGERLTREMLEGFDLSALQCAESRVVAADGVYACPILAGLPGARLSHERLEEALRPARLWHPACVTCHRTGASCRNG